MHSEQGKVNMRFTAGFARFRAQGFHLREPGLDLHGRAAASKAVLGRRLVKKACEQGSQPPRTNHRRETMHSHAARAPRSIALADTSAGIPADSIIRLTLYALLFVLAAYLAAEIVTHTQGIDALALTPR
jgi:hypothetical protein